ncbi:Hypothetical_protein [Hexamita inflata]|uniref:Hypothetical_protein n=1 Tax=Hexamita inflata TaxID=28002 RepID=A0AA86Q2L8_9EUKA|nr:Hypothetical protein HINF_LOCUS32887 [Hexamita inflata]
MLLERTNSLPTRRKRFCRMARLPTPVATRECSLAVCATSVNLNILLTESTTPMLDIDQERGHAVRKVQPADLELSSAVLPFANIRANFGDIQIVVSSDNLNQAQYVLQQITVDAKLLKYSVYTIN